MERNKTVLYNIWLSLMIVSISLTIYGCASVGRPQGGPYDEKPPMYVKSNPLPNQTKIKPTKIELVFDENIKLEKPTEKVFVSPPQLSQPIVRSNAKNVTVELADTLLPNTTYTIDFTDAIRDNNEGNALKDFSLSFSTGDMIDTLQISGTLLNAENLEPITGTYIGIHNNLQDSAFTAIPFLRIGKTDDLGHFSVKNIAPGTYKVYALKDINSNFMFDMPNEDIAFLDSLLVPTVEMKIHPDTIWKDSVSVDTIKYINVPHFYPDNLILLSFNENKKNVYLEKTERLDKEKVTFYFSAPEDSLPKLEGINFDINDWAVIENSPKNDTITYWIRDSLIYNRDTLQVVASYMHTDTLNNLTLNVDTIQLIAKPKKASQPKKDRRNDKNKKDSIVVKNMNVRDNINSSLEIGTVPRFIFEEPLVSFEEKGIKLRLKKDTIFTDVEFSLVPDSLRLREYIINTKLIPGEQYQFDIDSASIYSLYGLTNAPITKKFSIKKEEEYSNLVIPVMGLNTPAFVELLDKSDKPVRKAIVENGEATFKYVKPGEYYARIILDKNGNGLYDTGNYSEKRMPDEVRYYNDILNLKANFNVRQEWDVFALPLTKQKPLEITKNKPKVENQDDIKNNKNNKNNSRNEGMSYGGGQISGTRSYAN